MAIRRIGGKHCQRKEADDAQQLEHIQIVDRSPRYGIQHGQRRRGEVQRRFRRQRDLVHLPHKRKHLLDEQARFLIDSQQQNDQSGGQQNLPNRQPGKALSVKRGLHQQHRRVRRRRHDDKQRTVAPSSDIVEVAQRSGGNVIQGQRTRQQRGKRRAQQQAVPIGERLHRLYLLFHAAFPPSAFSSARLRRIFRRRSRETTTSAASIISPNTRSSTGLCRVRIGI